MFQFLFRPMCHETRGERSRMTHNTWLKRTLIVELVIRLHTYVNIDTFCRHCSSRLLNVLWWQQREDDLLGKKGHFSMRLFNLSNIRLKIKIPDPRVQFLKCLLVLWLPQDKLHFGDTDNVENNLNLIFNSPCLLWLAYIYSFTSSNDCWLKVSIWINYVSDKWIRSGWNPIPFYWIYLSLNGNFVNKQQAKHSCKKYCRQERTLII